LAEEALAEPINIHSQAAAPWAAYRRWSIVNRKMVKVKQTGTPWRLIVIIAVPEEGRFVVSLMVSLSPRQIEKRG
jgi:hypothetical protein